jgi:hypothetical protein
LKECLEENLEKKDLYEGGKIQLEPLTNFDARIVYKPSNTKDKDLTNFVSKARALNIQPC